MTSDMEQFVVQIPRSMKSAVGEFAATNNMAMTDVAREAFASYLGIEYVKAARTRAPKYETEAEKKKAQYDRAALIRWGRASASRLLSKGEITAASVIARAVDQRDYETLEALRTASEQPNPDVAASDAFIASLPDDDLTDEELDQILEDADIGSGLQEPRE